MKLNQGMQRHHRHDRSESGFSPLEISAGLIVVAVLSALGASMINSGLADMRIRTTYVRLQDVMSVAEDYISSTHSYSISTNDIVAQGSLPPSITPKTGGITIGYQTVTIAGASDHAEVKVQNLSRRACSRLLMYDFGSRVTERSADQTVAMPSRFTNLQFAETACSLPQGNTITFSLK